ncbi:MAG: SDR family oxidoreductase [Anaerolineales bacterium]|jgi:NAD(P)-dependent dehydrogenase (short-subunit alcohol dehydrogenase family)|nr:SDR family oxidoreductase [Anaerolineales bacterium]HNQ93981.1 SDR family oxidoreductase [Anaerolineales bacterium]
MDTPQNTEVIVLIGAGAIGQAIARRVASGKHLLLADVRESNAKAASDGMSSMGYQVSTQLVDVSSRESVHSLATAAANIGNVTGVIHTAGLSPTQASPEAILKVDLYGTALVLEEFGQVIAQGGSGIVIASMAGHMLPALGAEQDAALAQTPTDELLSLPMLQPDQISDSARAYGISKRANSLRVQSAAVQWGERGARVNAISPGIIYTPLAKDEMTGPNAAGYQRMIELCAVRRGGTPDEVGAVAALLMGLDGAFITGSDFLMDGGVVASMRFGALARR